MSMMCWQIGHLQAVLLDYSCVHALQIRTETISLYPVLLLALHVETQNHVECENLICNLS